MFSFLFGGPRCDCCNRFVMGHLVYVAGAFECPECARGEHRHARQAAA